MKCTRRKRKKIVQDDSDFFCVTVLTDVKNKREKQERHDRLTWTSVNRNRHLWLKTLLWQYLHVLIQVLFLAVSLEVK